MLPKLVFKIQEPQWLRTERREGTACVMATHQVIKAKKMAAMEFMAKEARDGEEANMFAREASATGHMMDPPAHLR